MLMPDESVELFTRLGVSFVRFIYERGASPICVPVRHAPCRLQRECTRLSLPLVLFAGEGHERFAQRDTELLQDRHQQFEVDRLERPVRCETIECTAADVDATVGQSALQLTDAHAPLAKGCPDRRDDNGVGW